MSSFLKTVFFILLLSFHASNFREKEMTLRAYSSIIYNALGDVLYNSQSLTTEDILGLGRRVYKSGHSEEVVVVIAHRHFDLAADEVMYEYAGPNGERIAEPRLLKDVMAEKAQPNVISCSPEGEWYPTSFEKSDSECQAWKDEHFLRKAAKYLKQKSLTNKLGLATRRSSSEDTYFVEENFNDKRQSITRPTTKEEVAQAIPTTYCFARGISKITQSCYLCGACYLHGNEITARKDAYPPGKQPSNRIDAVPSTFVLPQANL